MGLIASAKTWWKGVEPVRSFQAHQGNPVAEKRWYRSTDSSKKALLINQLNSGDETQIQKALTEIKTFDNFALNQFFTNENSQDDSAISKSFRDLIIGSGNKDALEIFLKYFQINKASQISVRGIPELDKAGIAEAISGYILNQEDGAASLKAASTISAHAKSHITSTQQKVSTPTSSTPTCENNYFYRLGSSGTHGKLLQDILFDHTEFTRDQDTLRKSKFTDNPDSSTVHQANRSNLYNDIVKSLPGFRLSDFNLEIEAADGTKTPYNIDTLIREMATEDSETAMQNFIKAYMALEAKKHELLIENDPSKIKETKAKIQDINKRQTKVLEFLFGDNKLRASESGQLISDQLFSYINSDKGITQFFFESLRVMQTQVEPELKEFASYFQDRFSRQLSLVDDDGKAYTVRSMRDLDDFSGLLNATLINITGDPASYLMTQLEIQTLDRYISAREELNDLVKSGVKQEVGLRTEIESLIVEIGNLKREGITSIDLSKRSPNAKAFLNKFDINESTNSLDQTFWEKFTKANQTKATNEISRTILDSTVTQLEGLKSSYEGMFNTLEIDKNACSIDTLKDLFYASIKDFREIGSDQEKYIKDGSAQTFLDELYGANPSELSAKRRLIYQALNKDSKEFQKTHEGSLSRGYIAKLASPDLEGNYSVEATHHSANLLISHITGTDGNSIAARKLVYTEMLGYREDQLDPNGYLQGFDLSESNKILPTVKDLINQQMVVSNAKINILTAAKERIQESVTRFASKAFDLSRISIESIQEKFETFFDNSEQYFASNDPKERMALITKNLELTGLNLDQVNFASISPNDLFTNPDMLVGDSSLKEIFMEVLEALFNMLGVKIKDGE